MSDSDAIDRMCPKRLVRMPLSLAELVAANHRETDA